MKKNTLDISYTFDFDLFGLSTSVREYRLAWEINKCCGINLCKEEDVVFELKSGKKVFISNYLHATEHQTLRMLKNKPVEGQASGFQYLVPELKQFDYLLLLEGEGDSLEESQLLAILNNLSVIQYFTKLDADKLKSKDNLIF